MKQHSFVRKTLQMLLVPLFLAWGGRLMRSSGSPDR